MRFLFLFNVKLSESVNEHWFDVEYHVTWMLLFDYEREWSSSEKHLVYWGSTIYIR